MYIACDKMCLVTMEMHNTLEMIRDTHQPLLSLTTDSRKSPSSWVIYNINEEIMTEIKLCNVMIVDFIQNCTN